MIDLQEIFNSMPQQLKSLVLSRNTKDKENLLILYALEKHEGALVDILEASGVEEPRFCKKCYGRGYVGRRGSGALVMCKCVHKQLKSRSSRLQIDWRK